MRIHPCFAVALTAACAARPAPTNAPAPVPAVAQEPAAVAPADPCRGARFDADRPDPRCLRRGEPRKSPDAQAVALRLLEPNPSVKSGAERTFTLEIANTSSADLPVTLYFGCGAFSAEASNDRATTFESECGGLCGQGDVLDLTLVPGGVIHKRVRIEAVMRKVDGDACTERELGPLPPGAYTLEVSLPWSDPTPTAEEPDAHSSRTFRTPLVVEPSGP
jgi:hypothetical protein